MEIKKISAIADIVNSYELGEIEVKDQDGQLIIRKYLRKNDLPDKKENTQEIRVLEKSKENSDQEVLGAKENFENLKSPMVGAFYSSPSPDQGPFVKEGDKVKKGQTVCIIEAMKMMNEIKAPYDCQIKSIRLKDKEPVGFDDVIMELYPNV